MIAVFRSFATLPSAHPSDPTSILSSFGNDSDFGILTLCLSTTRNPTLIPHTFQIYTSYPQTIFLFFQSVFVAFIFSACPRAKGSTNGKKDISFCVFSFISCDFCECFYEFP